MNHNYWELRKGTLIVEKYTGLVQLEDILSNDDQILKDTPTKPRQLTVLTDVSEAEFSKIQIEKIADTFQSLDQHSHKTHGMKLIETTSWHSYEAITARFLYCNMKIL